MIGEVGACQLVVKLTETHFLNEKLVSLGNCMVSYLSFGDSNVVLLMQAGACEQLLDCLTTYCDSEDVVRQR